MPHLSTDWLREHRALAAATASGSRAPYSGRREAAILLLSDGSWVPGVRIESASYPLLLPAHVSAFATAAAAGRLDAVALVLSRPALPEEHAYLSAAPAGPFTAVADDVYVRGGDGVVPVRGERLVPFLELPAPATPGEGVALARRVAAKAHVPESGFPVGCVLVLEDGRLVPGVNVEHRDWSRTLCAERTALGTALSYGLAAPATLYLSCPLDPSGSPCGACRQLLAEHAHDVSIWMDRGDAPPEPASPATLLPGSFTGRGLPVPPA